MLFTLPKRLAQQENEYSRGNMGNITEVSCCHMGCHFTQQNVSESFGIARPATPHAAAQAAAQHEQHSS